MEEEEDGDERLEEDMDEEEEGDRRSSESQSPLLLMRRPDGH